SAACHPCRDLAPRTPNTSRRIPRPAATRGSFHPDQRRPGHAQPPRRADALSRLRSRTRAKPSQGEEEGPRGSVCPSVEKGLAATHDRGRPLYHEAVDGHKGLLEKVLRSGVV